MPKYIFLAGFCNFGRTLLKHCLSYSKSIELVDNNSAVIREMMEGDTGNSYEDICYLIDIEKNKQLLRYFAEPDTRVQLLFLSRDLLDTFSIKKGKSGSRYFPFLRKSQINKHINELKTHQEKYQDYMISDNFYPVRFEDLHQNFHQSMKEIFNFLRIEVENESIDEIYNEVFLKGFAVSQSKARKMPKNSNEIKIWPTLLNDFEKTCFKDSKFATKYMADNKYNWNEISYKKILQAMKEGGVYFLDENEYLNCNLQQNTPNALLMHDIDLIDKAIILNIAKIEKESNVPSIFNFLPLDDYRYKKFSSDEIIDLINEIKTINARNSIGLHFNAAETYYLSGNDLSRDDRVDRALNYMHKQIGDYSKNGISFRTGTAHGFGKGNQEPNNRSEIFKTELKAQGIRLFDGDLRRAIDKKATNISRISDVGGTLSIFYIPNQLPIDEPETYRNQMPGSLIHFLTHPGNYDLTEPISIKKRINGTSKWTDNKKHNTVLL